MPNRFEVTHNRSLYIDNLLVKRIFDILFSLLAFVLVLSWLYPILAILIKLESRGPVIFKQLRSGRNNKSFWCYKFRSMRLNYEADKIQARKDDDRITILGRFLRKTSIDEFPQFFNVLKGDMSVVGPRPHMLQHTEQYRQIVANFKMRHYMKPGITGWAQVNGYRGETSTPDSMEKRVQHDIWYLYNWNAALDIKIVFLTAYSVFIGDKNAY